MNLPSTPCGRRKRLRKTSLVLLLAPALALFATGQVHADAVTDWNQTINQAANVIGSSPHQSYVAAMSHVAIHDALNSIDRRYATYAVVPAANANASPNAAIAAAARRVLIQQLNRPPETDAKANARAMVQSRYQEALDAIPDGTAKQQGIAAGVAAADAIIAMRSNDGSGTPNRPYTLAPAPGVYQPTPPGFVPPTYAGWAVLPPFTLTSPSQFRSPPGALFNLTGGAYTTDYAEVKAVGDARVRGAAPDSERSDIARFWPGGGGDWNATARVIVANRDLDRWQHARLFALLNLATADAAISEFDTKYAYNFWRPVTAIRWADDGNPATQPDHEWLSFINTPSYPDYVCGLTMTSGAATSVLRRYFVKDGISFSRTVQVPGVSLPSPMAPLPAKTITRSYTSLSQAAAESVNARVYGGMHFREGCEQGVVQGENVGRHVLQNYLQPLRSRLDY